ncbi:MAG: hypothetical protein E6Q33_10920 [Neisseriales bacterium]|nr:MAG: hypothetical protein E6Q33_10920 [Neisseriales bacterium]
MWLQDKAERDTELWGCPNPCWIIENKMYDLEKFAKQHPGGEHWINYTKGQ